LVCFALLCFGWTIVFGDPKSIRTIVHYAEDGRNYSTDPALVRTMIDSGQLMRGKNWTLFMLCFGIPLVSYTTKQPYDAYG
jgi:hypothetical protein